MHQPQTTDKRAGNYVGSTSRFNPLITVLLDKEDGFIMCKGDWIDIGGVKIPNTYAQRWYGGEGSGYPNGRGFPQWFIVPNSYGTMIEMGLGIRDLFKKEMKVFISNPDIKNSTRAQESAISG